MRFFVGLRKLKRLAGRQDGFTMINVMFAMMALGTFAVSAWALTTGDIPLARASQDQKRAYEAAQAGLQWYSYELDRDSAYWTKCDTAEITTGVPAPVNIEGANPRKWATLPGGGKYSLEIMKKRDTSGNPTTACSTANAVGTALQDNTLRLRSTGKANGQTRSIIATFKRRSFMDFVYFTNSEAQDPIVGGGTDAVCSGQRTQRGNTCTEITFVGPDVVKGPLHTNDSSVMTSGGTIQFGRDGKTDAFEVNGPSPGWVGTGNPVFKGPQTFMAGQMDPPPGNSSLKALATGWLYNGDTCLNFKSDNTVDVYTNQNWSATGRVTCNTSNGGTVVNRPLTGAGAPPNGVIYVQTDPAVVPSNCGYDKYERYLNDKACGDVAVSGTYGTNVTIASENDIVINADIKQKIGSDSMMGLVATGFVRVYHPIAGISSSGCGSTNNTPAGFTHVQEIDAAILSLAHSFMVDNYMCGTSEGTLKVIGAIAQSYRGVVGTGSGTTGYIKDYNYDDRLKIREPPNFLDPIKTSWRIVRQTEQKPATATP
jgi:type II secretory pathway pseudopilin PulG